MENSGGRAPINTRLVGRLRGRASRRAAARGRSSMEASSSNTACTSRGSSRLYTNSSSTNSPLVLNSRWIVVAGFFVSDVSLWAARPSQRRPSPDQIQPSHFHIPPPFFPCFFLSFCPLLCQFSKKNVGSTQSASLTRTAPLLWWDAAGGLGSAVQGRPTDQCKESKELQKGRGGLFTDFLRTLLQVLTA